MTFEKEMFNEYGVLKISGTLSVENIHRFEIELKELLDNKLHIIIDFINVKFIDSSSLGMIVLFFSKLDKIGKKLILTNINNDIYQMFSLTGIGKRVPICNDIEDAVDYIETNK